MEKIYRPQKFNATDKVNLKEFFASFSHFKFSDLGDASAKDRDALTFDTLNIVDQLEQHRLATDCSMDLLSSDFDLDESTDERGDHLDTFHVRDIYKSRLKQIYNRHRYHKIAYDTGLTSKIEIADLQPGSNFVVCIRIYHPFRFIYPLGPKRINPNMAANLKFSHEIMVLGSNTLAELRDRIYCRSDSGLCVEIDDLANIHPKSVYPSGFLFIDDTFYNDFRCNDSIDYSEVVRKWGQERDMFPMHSSDMSTTQIKELTPRFAYPYVYVHQGCCEHILVFRDAWLLSHEDNLQSKQYPMCTGIHQKYSKLCHICGTVSAKWICIDSDRLPQDRMLFCDSCFRSYNYNENGKIGEFKAYPYFNTNNTIK